MSSTLRIAHLYPAEMNIYGDQGNIIALVQRCLWRGIHVSVDSVNIGDKYDFGRADIIFGGGGQDKGQELVARDLLARQAKLEQAVAAGTPTLLICGLYQLFGRRFTTAVGEVLPGLGILGLETTGESQRMIGNVIIRTRFGQLVGFENHSGQTKLDDGQEPFGQVLQGSGNDASSGQEGAVLSNLIGTYLHGPILPKNPKLADFLIAKALENRGEAADLQPLDDTLEQQAASAAAKLHY